LVAALQRVVANSERFLEQFQGECFENKKEMQGASLDVNFA
jgi:hypothetical protein